MVHNNIYSHIESYKHLNRNRKVITRDPPTSSINILRDCLEDSCHIQTTWTSLNRNLCANLTVGRLEIM